ncbi:MAG: site-2 protease family protein [Planctomycetia bacterium]|nr:site-2 protease family protein [Planctomycetia bacterium]
MFYEPGETQYDLKFRFLGIPVRVHPFFWLLSIFLGMSCPAKELLVWIGAVLISVLIHEMGHAIVLRSYGFLPRIVLYSFGGLTIHDRYTRRLLWYENILVSAAGPFAGFLLAALAYLLLCGNIPLFQTIFASAFLKKILYMLIYINVAWGVFNLLPIFPLDGGNIARELCMHLSPRSGFAIALQISMVTAIIAALCFIHSGMFFGAFLFGWMAYSNWQMLQYRQM